MATKWQEIRDRLYARHPGLKERVEEEVRAREAELDAQAEGYGKTKSGVPITDELLDQLADEAEAGYDVDTMLRRRIDG